MNEDHSDRRRESDAVLMEMHGMLARLVERVEGHVQWDERVHEESKLAIQRIDSRMEPIEEFHRSMRTAGKVGAVVATPALLAVGAGLWEWVRGIFSHAKVP